MRGDLLLVRQQVVLDLGLVRRGGGEQHGEADVGDDQPAGDAQAGNGDAEYLHHQAATVEADEHDQGHVEAGLENLPVALGRWQAAAETEQQRDAGQRVGHRQHGEQADQDVMEVFAHGFSSFAWGAPHGTANEAA